MPEAGQRSEISVESFYIGPNYVCLGVWCGLESNR